MTKEPVYESVRQNSREVLPFAEQLKRYQSAGVQITFANANLSLEDIVRICTVREKGEYMCDFVADEDNRIVRIDVNLVKDHGADMGWSRDPKKSGMH